MIMKHCEYCNVSVDGTKERCPLCGKKLAGSSGPEKRAYPVYQAAEEKLPVKNTRHKMLLVSLVIICICALVNLLTRGTNGGYWFMDITVILAYLWVLVLHTVRSKARGCVKFLVQTCMISFMMIVFDLNAGGGMWSVTFGIPFESTAMIFLANYIVFSKKMRWSEYLSYGFMVLLIGFAPMLAVQIGIVHMAWPFFLCATCALVSFLFMMICADRNCKEEATRRFRF